MFSSLLITAPPTAWVNQGSASAAVIAQQTRRQEVRVDTAFVRGHVRTIRDIALGVNASSCTGHSAACVHRLSIVKVLCGS